jgi:hypothetical protein
LPDGSIVYHVDKADIFEAHKVLGGRFCLSGGIPNYLLALGTPDEVRACCKRVIDGVARDGGYIMDASAIIQNDARVENVRAMTDFTREYGVYSQAASGPTPGAATGPGMAGRKESRIKPGVCLPWEEKLKELPEIKGDKELVKRIWESIDALGYTYIWHCLLSF